MMIQFFKCFGSVINNGAIYKPGVFCITYREIVCILIGILIAVVFDAFYTIICTEVKKHGKDKRDRNNHKSG